jgi:hypothetical protein
MLDALERPQSVFALQKALRESTPEEPSVVDTKLDTVARKIRGLFSGFGRSEGKHPTTIQETTLLK